MEETMKTITALTAATLIAASGAMAAEQHAPKSLVEKPGLVTALDNDGGRVELYARSHNARELEFHGGAIVREPLVEVVFVGAWEKSRAGALRNAIDRVSATDAFQSTRDRGVKATALPITTRALAGSDTMNDLDVQRMIDRAIENGSLPSRDDNTVYVLFLAPNVASTLGEKHAVTDYASYHSHFHTHDVNVRYVVVPFDEDAKSMNDAAAASLIRAIVNPDGDGWY
jgi:hypothetical protein